MKVGKKNTKVNWSDCQTHPHRPVPQCHISPLPQHLQGRLLHHLTSPGSLCQCLPAFGWDFPYIQPPVANLHKDVGYCLWSGCEGGKLRPIATDTTYTGVNLDFLSTWHCKSHILGQCCFLWLLEEIPPTPGKMHVYPKTNTVWQLTAQPTNMPNHTNPLLKERGWHKHMLNFIYYI